MFRHKIAILSLAGVLAVPGFARADKWYQSPWFWGGTGLVGGGVVGYVIGKETSRPRAYAPAPYSQPAYGYASSGPINSTGATYYREKWAFPFYHKIESYPIASTMPFVYQPQAVSMAGAWEPEAHVYRESPPADAADAPRDLSINIGDNNQNVNISLGGKDLSLVESKPAPVEQVYNNPSTVGSRVVDVTQGAAGIQPHIPVGSIPEPTKDKVVAPAPKAAEPVKETEPTAPAEDAPAAEAPAEVPAAAPAPI